jgi:hypothetical protein
MLTPQTCSLSMFLLPSRSTICALVVVLLLSTISFAQSPRELQIIATDENGVAVPGARVSLQPVGKSTVLRAETDFAGHSHFRGIIPGLYRLRVEKQGFYLLEQQNLRLGDLGRVDVALNHQQEIKEEVNVVESPPAIDPERTANTESLSGVDVVNIPYPVTRDYRRVLPFIPGVVSDSQGQPHVAGGRTNETLDMFDGFDITDPVDGLLHLRVSTDAIRSIDVQSSRYSAQYGRASAGVLSLATGIGDNKLRYSATNFLPSVKFIRGIGLDKWTPRATISGPLRKGKIWFFEGLDGEYDQNIIRDLPPGADTAPLWRFSNLIKLQTNITPSNILTGSLLFNRFKYSHAGLSGFNPLAATVSLDQTAYLSSIKDQHYFAGGTLLETGVALFEQEADELPLGNATYVIRPSGISGNYYRTSLARSHRWQWITNVYFRPVTKYGKHEFKLGVDGTRIAYHQFVNRTPVLIFRESGTLVRNVVFPGEPVSFSKNNVQASGYFQDRWSPTDRLLVEAGLRFDADQVIRDLLVAPRFAATYILDANGDTKLSGGIGLFYDATSMQEISRPLRGQRLDYFFAADGTTLLGPPLASTFSANEDALRAPRFLNWSIGLERKLPRGVYLRAEFLQRHGKRGFVYLPLGSFLSGNYVLTNLRQDHYDSFQVTLRHTFRKSYAVLAAYTRSSARTNAVLNYDVDLLEFGPQGSGPLPWDAPNRFISWGLAPLPTMPLVHHLDLAWSTDWHDGFPFSIVNQNQQFLPPLQSQHFPRFFSLNLYLEKRVNLLKYTFALRGGFDNVTNHPNRNAVNNNIDSSSFLHFSNLDRRTFIGRIRFLGRK